jgi:hypothetical protein
MENKNPLHFATQDQIQEFVKEKKLDGSCPVCNDSKEEWSLYGDANDLYHPHIFRKPQGEDNLIATSEWAVIHCYTLICNNCGYLRTFSKWIVKKWVESKK